MADRMHLIDDYVKDHYREQVKDIKRLNRKVLYLGYISKPINAVKSECVDTQFKG